MPSYRVPSLLIDFLSLPAQHVLSLSPDIIVGALTVNSLERSSVQVWSNSRSTLVVGSRTMITTASMLTPRRATLIFCA
jgi:hypothetical protein